MAINVKTDEVGTDVSIAGAVGDTFAEALFTVAQLAMDYKEKSEVLFGAFGNYVIKVIEEINKGDEDGGFDPKTFSSDILKLVRSNPENVEAEYTKLLEKYDEEAAANIAVLLALPSDFIETDAAETVDKFIN